MLRMLQIFALSGDGLSVSQRSSTAGVVMLEGMAAIFLVLAIIWGAIEIMHRLLHKGEQTEKKTPAEKRTRKAESTVASPNADDAAVAAAIAAALAASEDEGATVATITAAISAALAEEGHTGGFRVVSCKRAAAQNRRRF